ncbi:ATP-binding protein [Pontiella sp.]|uniref:sensor histidine kinase n=1 Tax=Pontiella sp. TaxID=2837462 RepID=UPI003567DABD
MKNISKRKPLVLAISLVMVVGFLSTSLISYYIARASMREQIVSNSLPLTSDNIYSEIQRDLIPPVFISSLMAQDTFLRDWVLEGEQEVDKITRYLQEIRTTYDTFTCFFVSEATHKYYCFNGVLKQVRPTEERDAWYFRVRSMDGLYETNVDPDMANKDTMTIFINYKVFDYDGQYIGAAGVGLKVGSLIDLMKRYSLKYSRNLYLTDPAGNIVLSSNDTYANVDEIEGMRTVRDELLSLDGGVFDYKRDGSMVFLNSRYIDELKWHLLVEELESGSTQGISHALFLNLAICGVITLAILLIVAYSVARYEKAGREQEAVILDQHRRLEQNIEALAEANQKKNTLLHILCHDLANPFGALISSLDELESDPGMLAELLPHIRKSLDNGMGTIELVRKMRAVEEGRIDLPLQSLPLKRALEETMAMLDGMLRRKQIDVVLEVPDDITVSVERFSFNNSVLNNLLTNAIKFSVPKAKIRISAVRAADGKVRLSIADDGIGMPETILEALFNFKANTTRAGTLGELGTGFGMPLVEQFVRAFGGSIEVASRDIEQFPADHGTEVVLTLNP